jgi:hypothetical protein
MINERIKQLADVAGFMDSWFSESGDDCEQELKKFAELIVEECVTQCWIVSESDSRGSIVSECSKRIRKHFGVNQ